MYPASPRTPNGLGKDAWFNVLGAHGFTLDLRKRDVTAEVEVTTLPGFSGPEVTFTTSVPKGTTVIVTA
jgi:hypothetical protein